MIKHETGQFGKTHNFELAFVGSSGLGKTTLISKLIANFQHRYDITYAKLGAHYFEIDHPGKDSFQASEAGASQIVLQDKTHHAVISKEQLEQVDLERQLSGSDWIFWEGRKNSDLAKFVFYDAQGEYLSILKKSKNVLALIVPRNEKPQELPAEFRDLPYFHRDNIRDIAQSLEAYFQDSKAPLKGLVLLGGKSRRMDLSKEAISYHKDKNQASYIADILEKLCLEVFISVADEGQQLPKSIEHLPKIVDKHSNIGPLAGISAALQDHADTAWLVLSCDLPLVKLANLQHLLSRRNHYRFATVYADNSPADLPEPMCAIYEPKILGKIVEYLALGWNCPRKLLLNSKVELIQSLEADSLWNANSWDDLQYAKKRLGTETRKPSTATYKKEPLLAVPDVDKILKSFSKNNELDFGQSKVAIGRSRRHTLAEDILADRAYPSFNRAAMDGIAVRFADIQDTKKTYIFRSLGLQKPGQAPLSLEEAQLNLGNEIPCIEIMTGAMVPEFFDLVIIYEELRAEAGTAIWQALNPGTREDLEQWQNIHRFGSDYRAGQVLVPKNSIINSSIIGILASVGCSLVPIHNKPQISLLTTGDELVPIEQEPPIYKIRESNNYSLAAELSAWQLTPRRMSYCADDKDRLKIALQVEEEFNSVIILVGGMSKGKFDLSSQVLQELDYTIVFHGILQKPGKPFLLARKRDRSSKWQYVFGMPGNPVSCLVTLRRYVIPLLLNRYETTSKKALLTSEIQNHRLSLYAAVTTEETKRGIEARLLNSNGSGDFFHLAKSSGFIQLDPRAAPYQAGDIVKFYPWGSI